MALTTNKRNFVAALLADANYCQTRAYEIVFAQRGNAASSAAAAMVREPEVAALIAEGKAARLKRMELTADDVLRDIALGLATSDSGLSELVLDSCRYCHGAGHRYHMTPREYESSLNDYLADDRARKGGPIDPMGLRFDMRGGVGFDPRKAPAEDCPECFGRGVERILPKDTRYLSEAGKRNYVGVKPTKNGPEMQMRSRDKALEIAAKHTGVAKENLVIKTIRDLSEDELAAKTKALEAKLGKAVP